MLNSIQPQCYSVMLSVLYISLYVRFTLMSPESTISEGISEQLLQHGKI